MYVALGGLQDQLESLDRIAAKLAEQATQSDPGRRAELLVQATEHQRAAEANLTSLRIVDETIGNLLDVFA